MTDGRDNKYAPDPPRAWTPEEIALKDRLTAELDLPDWCDETVVYRFLVARSFDFEKACEMLTNHINFREDFKAWDDERIFQTTEYKSRFVYILEKPDFWGRPVVYARPRFINPALREGKSDEVEQCFIYWLTTLDRSAAKNGAQKCVVIFDQNQFGLRSRDQEHGKMMIEHLQIASMWMDQNTISKIHFADQSEIYKCVPRSSLPKGVGGDVPDLPPLVDVWPQDKANTGGWFSWFRSSTSSSSTAALPDDDPFAGLDDEQRAARERELEEKLLQEAAQVNKRAIEVKAANESKAPKRRHRRRRNNRKK